MKYTLKSLLQKYDVMIPQIQRDYAQGRESALELRKGFVSAIHQSIKDGGKNLNLDFIYGYTTKEGRAKEIFIPLDGQQRLTTLWLTHWLLAPRKANKIIDEAKDYLKSFSYETRVSSSRFCSNLIDNPLNIGSGLLSAHIIDAPWFMSSWKNDPTVSSMLNMIDTLQAKEFEKETCWDNIAQKERVTFDLIDIKSEEFKLTDELYIKMNSRGKGLTTFENFKAQFSGLLASKTTDYSEDTLIYNNNQVSYQQYFAFKIDSEWMDLFWKYRDVTALSTDENINNFIYFVAGFLYSKGESQSTNAYPNGSFEFLSEVFTKKANIEFLFNSLDFLSSLRDTNSFFESIFNCVPTFDYNTSNYFLRCIGNMSLDVKEKNIFYAILSYCNKQSLQEADDNFRDFVRIVRNLLLTVRQPNNRESIKYMSNLRLPEVSKYSKFIDTFVEKIKKGNNNSVYQALLENEFEGFSKGSIAHEKAKAEIIIANDSRDTVQKLEDHYELKGNLNNFKLQADNIEQKADAFMKIWDGEVEDSLIIRALLTIDDYSIEIRDYSSLGGIWYFGCRGEWNRILTTSDKTSRVKISDTLDAFLEKYLNATGDNSTEKLQYIIDGFQPNSKDWRYYFIKYKYITDNLNFHLNVFSWQDDGFKINQLGNSGTHPLHSYHVNPYLSVLKRNFPLYYNICLNRGRFTDISSLEINGNVRINCIDEGWLITCLNGFEIKEEIVSKYKLNKLNNFISSDSYFRLTENAQKDRIEIATEFIKEFI